jgi:glycosyltransferase involved in cell wall biosynthesis
MATEQRPRLLMLNLFSVHPPDTGAKVVIWNRIVELSRFFDVTFCFRDDVEQPIAEASLDALAAHCRVVRVPPRLGASPLGLELFRQPAVRLFHRRVRSWLRDPAVRSLQRETFDIVELHSSCWYRDEIQSFAGSRVLVAHNDEAEYWQAQAIAASGDPTARAGARFDALQARRQQRDALAACDALVTLSERDLVTLRHAAGDKPALAHVGGVDCSAYDEVAGTEPEEPRTMVCIATFVDAVALSARRFADDVLPAIRSREPSATLRLVGDHRDHPALSPLRERPGIALTGRVDDVRPELRRAGIVVAPIESGGGIRMKLMEACAAGRAIVTTRKGAEGLELIDGEHALVVPDLSEMTKAVDALIQDPALRGRLATAARRLALRRFDSGPSHGRLADWYLRLVGRA